MPRQKKNSGNQDTLLKVIILMTAVLQLVKALIDLIRDVT